MDAIDFEQMEEFKVLCLSFLVVRIGHHKSVVLTLADLR